MNNLSNVEVDAEQKSAVEALSARPQKSQKALWIMFTVIIFALSTAYSFMGGSKRGGHRLKGFQSNEAPVSPLVGGRIGNQVIQAGGTLRTISPDEERVREMIETQFRKSQRAQAAAQASK